MRTACTAATAALPRIPPEGEGRIATMGPATDVDSTAAGVGELRVQGASAETMDTEADRPKCGAGCFAPARAGPPSAVLPCVL